MQKMIDPQKDKKNNSRKTGSILIVIGSLLLAPANNVAQGSASAGELTGAYFFPVLFLGFGFYKFFKGGGKVA